MWVVGDSTNGYFSRFDVYTGRQENHEVGLGEHVVKMLTDDIKHKKKHHVYFDNFFYERETPSKISNVMASTAVGPPGKIEGDFPLL